MIKLFEQYNEYNDVKDWLDFYNIKNYIINDDLTVDVDGDIHLDYEIFDELELPIQFGTIQGDFNMSHCGVTSLKGSPIKVMGTFWCDFNKIKSLEYSPEYIGGKFHFEHNDITSLQHLPKNIKGDILWKPNTLLPQEIQDYYSLENLIKYQDEYGIWNQDGSFNKARWELFIKDYETGLLV